MKLERINSEKNQGRKRPIALLDVDHTLVYTSFIKNAADENEMDEFGHVKTETHYNLELLNKLKMNSIRDIYLFTDMTISKNSLDDRKKLIKVLEEEGFTVHGVITPLDFFWTANTEMLRKFEEATGRAKIVLKAESQKNTDLLHNITEQFPDFTEHMNSKKFPRVGVAFKETTEPLNFSDPAKLKDFQLRGSACKHAIDVMSILQNISTCKGIMFRQFLSYLENWISAIYVFDDIEENITAVIQSSNTTIPVYAVNGEFSEKHNTFSRYTHINPLEISVEWRLTTVALDALSFVTKLKKEKTLGDIRYKSEFDQVLQLVARIQACEDSADKIRDIFINHFRKIPKSFFGSFQLSILDSHLLQLFCSDEIICKKFEIELADLVNRTDSKAIETSNQKILEALLSNRNSSEANTSQPPKLPSQRSTGSITLFSSGKLRDKSIMRTTRQRSHSEASKPLDTISGAIKSKSYSAESEKLDELREKPVLTASMMDMVFNAADNHMHDSTDNHSKTQLKALQTLTPILEEDETNVVDDRLQDFRVK